MGYEENARNNHRSGFNCAMSVYVAYADELGLTTEQARATAPMPRSEGGKCGAFLAGRKILEQLKPDAVEGYEKSFIEMNGQTECSRLVAAHGVLRKSCNDYVGDAARLVAEALNYNSAEQEGGSYERNIKDAGNKTKLQELQTGHGERR